MGRVKTIVEANGKYPYYVEMWDETKKLWKAEVRYYEVKQDPKNFPDNRRRRKFKSLSDEEWGTQKLVESSIKIEKWQ